MPRYLPRRLTGMVLFGLLASFQTQGADVCEPVIGRIVSVEGMVEVQRTGASRWQAAELNDVLCQGDTVRSGAKSRTALALINEAVLRLDQLTTLQLVDIVPEPEEQSILEHIKGLFSSFSRQPRTMAINTAYLNGAIEGTEFVVQTDEERSTITVLEGIVRASNDLGSIAVAQGEAATAAAGEAPQLRTVVSPRDAVQWSLYYPPILAFVGGASGSVPADLPAHLRTAMQAAAGGDIGAAYAELDSVAEADRDANFYLYRAALGLSVGRVDEARADIQQALDLDPDAGLAYSLRAVIEIVQNETDAALASAARGVELSDTAAARIALSYAQQSNFQIEAARDTLQAAVEQHPDDPLAWARLGELWLMLGNSGESRAAAQRATDLAPDLARTQLVLGYAALAEFRNADARAAFERAIDLSSADPLAHLGLGLAKISSGNLEEGRQDLEVAVGLDANNALLRAYLGKGYFEEKRYPLDSEQYSIAKQLDPNDPTAYLYDGILNQTVNRPVEAVEELTRSIELNDNRAVYRSRLLLDKDRAARGTSLARAYKDLGFTQLGINESTKSLTLDPSNASAHRFLSDNYLGTRRTEIARVSELLQAQLMQDINVNPVQPSISETNLNIVTLGGPASPGFNEFTPLFQQNETQLNITGVGGSDDTYGGEAVVSGLHDRLSYSVGGFTFDTDGWRPNNGLEQDIYNVFVQGVITPELNAQVDLLHRESTEGDLAFNFDPRDFLQESTLETERDSARVGVRYSPDPSSNFLLSYIYSDLQRNSDVIDPVDPVTTITSRFDENTDGNLIEGQYMYQGSRANLVTGASYADSETIVDDFFEVNILGVGPIVSRVDRIMEEIEHPRAYAYANIHTGEESVDWTIGASYDDFTQTPIEATSLNPKLGVRWNVTEALTVRAAAFKVLTPSLINNRTVEPTQVAGFNQFFDDGPGVESWRYGAAVDGFAAEEISWGLQFTWRDLDEPNVLLSETGEDQSVFFEKQQEQQHRLYAYWAPLDRVAVTAAIEYDHYESDMGLNTQFTNRPEELTTFSMPLAVNYFHPNGFFATVGGTFVDQEVQRPESSTFAQGDDSFFLVDLAVGYRFAKRRGVVSLGVKNLFDKKFMFQDDSFREFSEDATTGPYFPERIILGRVTLSF